MMGSCANIRTNSVVVAVVGIISSPKQKSSTLIIPSTLLINPLLLYTTTSRSSIYSHPHPHPHRVNSNARILTVSSAASTVPEDVQEEEEEEEEENNNMTTNKPSKWSEFATRVSGEWDGYGADFTSDGKPIELPESVVPEAYREWEVKVFDWQTQCPTLAHHADSLLLYRLIKLLPTVGCEADAATRYTIDERNIGELHPRTNSSAFAYQPSGCYVAIWPILHHPKHRLLELEYCLVDPRNHESRVRVIQVIRVEDTKLVLQNIKIFCEQWCGPFRNGDQLGGCAIRDSAFASTQPLKGSEVIGAWQGLHAVANFQNSQTNIIQELVDGNVRKSVRDECNLVLLPKQLWCSLQEREDGETCFEVGWLLDQGRALTSKCTFLSNAELKEITVASEAAALAQ